MLEKKKGLPTTSYTVLGVLTLGAELSGYDIRRWAQGMNHFYTSPAQSQVYSELKRLEERGYVLSRVVLQDGKPDKRLYQITTTGIDEFKRWMASDELKTTTLMKHPTLLKLFFGHAAPPTVLIEMLETFVGQIQESLGQLAIVQEFMEDDPALEYPALVAEWAYYHNQAELIMAKRLIEKLNNQETDTHRD